MELSGVLNLLIKYLSGLLLIGVIVFLHEVGHFLTARLMKVDVEVLSYGFGPRLFSHFGYNTEYRISLLPFGGYCRMKGDVELSKALHDDMDSFDKTEKGSFFAARPLARFLIFLSGPLMNFLVAVLLLTLASAIPVERISNQALVAPITAYPEIFHQKDIRQDGIEEGDRILEVDGKRIEDYQEFVSLLPKDGSSIEVLIERCGTEKRLVLTPTLYQDAYSFGLTLYEEPVIAQVDDPLLQDGDRIVEVDGKGIGSNLDFLASVKDGSIITFERNGQLFDYKLSSTDSIPFAWKAEIIKESDEDGLLSALGHGIERAWQYFTSTLRALGALLTLQFDDLREIIIGPMKASVSISEIGAKAFKVSGQSGVRTLCYLLSIVSISLCVGNLLPIPTFDGGGMLMSLAEAVKGSPLRPRTYVYLQILGMIAAFLIIAWMYSFDILALLSR